MPTDLPAISARKRKAQAQTRRAIAYIGGATPSRPTLIAGAVIVPSGIFCPATMKIWAPGLRSPRFPGTNRTTGTLFRAESGYDQACPLGRKPRCSII
jgi:hypothetical protein